MYFYQLAPHELDMYVMSFLLLKKIQFNIRNSINVPCIMCMQVPIKKKADVIILKVVDNRLYLYFLNFKQLSYFFN